MPHPLDPAVSKLKRADDHIGALQTEVDKFLRSNPYRIEGKINKKGTREVWSIVIDPIPSDITVIAADAVHNLRTPLDKMLASGFRDSRLHTPQSSAQKIKFPGVRHAKELRKVLADLSQNLTPDVIDFIASTQPYIGGAGEAICIINALDNRDKHRALLEPMKSGFATSGMEEVRVYSGWMFRIGSPRGTNFIPSSDGGHLVAPSDDKRAILRKNEKTGRHYLEFWSEHDDMEVFTLTPGAKFDIKIEPHLNVAFKDAGSFDGVPVVDALRSMQTLVDQIVTEFRARFF